ncbi:MAG TPA: helix-turn-helix transcriptional regulator [Mycobacteriales bacterium]|nr:helix-turn-helix transcriptional regulator [Mycobacteriales bacterium]
MAEPPEDRPVYVISVAAELAGMHPQTLRGYDRLGLVTPGRAVGRGRRYSERDVARLREVQRLSQTDGVNLAGIKQIIELQNQVLALQLRVSEMQAELARCREESERRESSVRASYRRELVPVAHTDVVVWRPERRGD